ncbi:hypothetical protein GBAR_LOCUS12352 [Geodia barretti]|uniref:Uncharacterized protein n=1 Tax=Geodia barretti TaxID=519541 RepID=A0AA35RZS3_GEOBA|nr:hypothetical protein GBAR_LOCUS12352 [Geodia barretti]
MAMIYAVYNLTPLDSRLGYLMDLGVSCGGIDLMLSVFLTASSL